MASDPDKIFLIPHRILKIDFGKHIELSQVDATLRISSDVLLILEKPEKWVSTVLNYILNECKKQSISVKL